MPVIRGDVAEAVTENSNEVTITKKAAERRPFLSSSLLVGPSIPRLLLRQQVLHNLAILYDLDRPIARSDQVLRRIDSHLVVDRASQVLDRERIVVRLATCWIG